MLPFIPKAARSRLCVQFLPLLGIPAVLVMASCGGSEDGLGKRYPVSGTVNYNGKPLEKGEISFVSEDITKNFSSGATIANGKYTLSTGGNGDGAAAGKYKVIVKSKEDYNDKAQAAFQKESGKDNLKIPPQFRAKAEASAKSMIPAGYGDPRSTNLSAEVKEEPNTINFELSDSSAPPEPPKAGGAAKGRHLD
jgi:hypothetical protein